LWFLQAEHDESVHSAGRKQIQSNGKHKADPQGYHPDRLRAEAAVGNQRRGESLDSYFGFSIVILFFDFSRPPLDPFNQRITPVIG
jgi:hypothetical protein